MSSLSAEAVFAAAPGGDPGWAMRSAISATIGLEDQVPPGKALAVWVFSLLAKEHPGKTEVLANWFKSLSGWAWELATENQPPYVLSVTAGRYVGLTSLMSVTDLETGESFKKMPGAWFECRIFNLHTLNAACRRAAEEWTQKQQKSGQTQTSRP